MPRRLLAAPGEIDAADQALLIDAARALARASASGAAPPLRGKNIALVSALPGAAAAREFDRIASALGARVAHLQAQVSGLEDADAYAAETARLLESLYDAVDCEAVPPGFALRLQARLRVPVFDQLGQADHPIVALAPQLEREGPTPLPEARFRLVQALLVSVLV